MDIYFDRIKPLFDQSGETDAELERAIGIPAKKISQWNIRYTKSYRKYIPQIAAHFHVSTDYLLGNTDDPRPVGALSGDDQQKKPAPRSGSELSDLDYIKSRLPYMSKEDLATLMAELPKIFMAK